jgi:hypothetical protein
MCKPAPLAFLLSSICDCAIPLPHDIRRVSVF